MSRHSHNDRSLLCELLWALSALFLVGLVVYVLVESIQEFKNRPPR